MLIRELTTPECHGVLKEATLARLACARDNQPYVVPVHVYFDGDCLYSFAILGQKIAWMRENPRVCVQVDDISDPTHWTTVVVFGRYEELLHMPIHEDARERARELFQEQPEWWLPAAAPSGLPTVGMPMVYRIRIEEMTGRRSERAHGEKAGKPWWFDLLFERTNTTPEKSGD